MSVNSAADRVAAFVPTRGLTELADVWAQYDELAARSYLGMGTKAPGARVDTTNRGARRRP